MLQCALTLNANPKFCTGTVDPDVPDKESGVLAMQAFLALLDATGDKDEWLPAAAQAADYVCNFCLEPRVILPTYISAHLHSPERNLCVCLVDTN